MYEEIIDFVKTIVKTKTVKIVAGVILGIVIIFGVTIHFINSYLASDNFKKTVNTEFANATGMTLGYDKMTLKLAFPLKAKVDLESPVIHYSDNSVMFSSEYLGTQVELLPLIFKTVEISDFTLKKPNIFLMRDKDGKFLGLEKFVPQEDSDEIVVDDKSSDNNFNIILHNVKISDYKVSFMDAYAPSLLDVLASGKIIEVEKFDMNKYVAAKADGIFSINGQEHFTYNADVKVNLASILKEIEDNEQIEPAKNNQQEVNPLYEIARNNLKANINTQVNIKSFDNIKGYFEVNKLSAKINKYQLPDSNLNMVFKGSNLEILSKLFVSPDASLEVSGKVNYKKKINTDLSVKSSELYLKEIKDFLLAIGTVIPNFDINALNVSGSFKIDAKVKSTPNSLDCSGFINLNDILIGYEGIKPTLNHLKGKISMDENGVSLNGVKANIDKSPLNISGSIDNKMNADITAMIPGINLQSLMNSLKESDVDQEIKNQLNKIQNMSGIVSVKTVLKGKVDKIQPQAEIHMNSFSVRHKDVGVPVNITRGVVALENQRVNVDIPAVNINSSKSSLNVKGIANLKDKIDFDISAQGKLNESDIAKLAGMSGLAKGNVPVSIQISGNPEKINTKAKIENTTSNYFLLSGLEQNTNIVLDGVLKGNSFEIVNTGLYTSSSKKLLDLSGKITSLDKKEPKLDDIRIHTTAPIKLNLPIGMTNSSFLAADLKINGSISNPKINGYLKVQNMSLPQIGISAGVVDLKITESLISIKVPNLKAKSSSLAFSAEGPAKFVLPYSISKVTVVSPFLNIDEIGGIAASISSTGSSSSSSVAKSAGAIADSPVTIKNGTLSVDKLILNNTEFSNLSSNFALNKKYDALLTSLKTSTMGGVADGKVTYNLMNGSVDMNVKASNINSDTFAVKFLGMPAKTISGLAEAKAVLKFSGTSPVEITKTLNGNVDLSISNGEMGSFGRMDFYLNASNIISNNAVSNAINKVVNLSTLSKTGKFDRAYGKLTFYKGGNMKINHFKTEGPKLSLYMKGDLNDISFNGNLQIMGRLSEDMVQSLGPLSQAAMDKIMNTLAPLSDLLSISTSAYQTTASSSDKKQIPMLTGSNEGSATFLVKINGNVFKPSSVRTFKWIKEQVVQPSSTSNSADTQTPSQDTSSSPADDSSSSTAPKRQVDVEKIQQLIKDPKQILLNF